MPDQPIRQPWWQVGIAESKQLNKQVLSDVARLRALSFKERGSMIEAACRTAATIYQSRLRTGLPDAQPAPWPASTVEFLRKHAPNARR